ncbi:hypothetical protein R3P38DRAFT_2815008 [Favolaschia claudopus]|uniref:Uncharacterized protein n=1 Tax=Favolaschia claudopus TaxID=2862362 RepID=A0AAV9Z230_9AGAR
MAEGGGETATGGLSAFRAVSSWVSVRGSGCRIPGVKAVLWRSGIGASAGVAHAWDVDVEDERLGEVGVASGLRRSVWSTRIAVVGWNERSHAANRISAGLRSENGGSKAKWVVGRGRSAGKKKSKGIGKRTDNLLFLHHNPRLADSGRRDVESAWMRKGEVDGGDARCAPTGSERTLRVRCGNNEKSGRITSFSRDEDKGRAAYGGRAGRREEGRNGLGTLSCLVVLVTADKSTRDESVAAGEGQAADGKTGWREGVVLLVVVGRSRRWWWWKARELMTALIDRRRSSACRETPKISCGGRRVGVGSGGRGGKVAGVAGECPEWWGRVAGDTVYENDFVWREWQKLTQEWPSGGREPWEVADTSEKHGGQVSGVGGVAESYDQGLSDGIKILSKFGH